MTTLAIPVAEVEKIRDHGRRDYPHECCGALLGSQTSDRKIVAEARALQNARSDSPRNRFLTLTTVGEWQNLESYARGRNLQILGFYHSHPDHPPRPSEYDREHAWPYWSYVILSVEQGRPAELFSWVLAEDRSRFDAEALEILNHR